MEIQVFNSAPSLVMGKVDEPPTTSSRAVAGACLGHHGWLGGGDRGVRGTDLPEEPDLWAEA